MDTFHAVIFDVDGVLVASPHERAWREALAELMTTEWAHDTGTYVPERFTTRVYQEHVAGKARLAGARAALAYFDVPNLERRTLEYASRKQRRIEALIDTGQFVAFADAVRFVLAVKARGLRLAAASSSKNADRFMARIPLDRPPSRPDQGALLAAGATLRDFFEVNVCGRDLPQGKPHPEIFLVAARELGVSPGACVVVEDAPSGVQAAKAGGMVTLGIARLGDEALLVAAGADLVVTSLDEIDVDALLRGKLERVAGGRRDLDGSPLTQAREPDDWLASAMQPSTDPQWVLSEHGYMPLRETGIESRFAISNGFLGVRGARAISRGPMWMSFLHTLSWASWPRTFVAGLFDTPNTEPPVPALAPAPDWLRLRVLLDGEPILLRSGELRVHSRTLDMRRGVLFTEWHQRDAKGRVIRLRTARLVSLANRAIGVQMIRLAIEGASAQVTLEAPLEMANSGVELVRNDASAVTLQTLGSGKCLGIASAAEVRLDTRLLSPLEDDQLRRSWTWTSVPGEVTTVRRMVAFARSDRDGGEVRTKARQALLRGLEVGWHGVVDGHARAWAERWSCSDIEIDGDVDAQRALRFAMYHLNSAANPDDEHVSIGARALTGDAYLGHVFWDTEIYLLPFYVFTWPEAARALLMYRHHTLPAARAKAARMGYRGALYAWESADTGEETTPERIIDPDGRILQVLCGTLEQHISADVAYAVWQYWQATGDEEFLVDAGGEILLETARFWASRVETDADGSYHIRDVIGPDEYHEHVDDDAFTNVMARWNIERALDAITFLRNLHPTRWQTLARNLDLSERELAHWHDVAARLATGFDAGTGLFEQFRGYFDLEPIDVAQYAGRTVPMDVVLGRERTQRSQVIKQPDVVALLALLPDAFELRVHEANLRYYEPRCGHGSSLSRGMHAVVAARLGDVELAARYFDGTAAIDLADTRGGSAGGIRIAALGGLWQAAVFGFIGLSTRSDGIAFDPHLPPRWCSVRLRVRWRGRRVRVHLDDATRTLAATLDSGSPLMLHVAGRAHELRQGEPLRVGWQQPDTRATGGRAPSQPPGA